MTLRKADDIRMRYYELADPTEEDLFRFTEAMDFLILETKDPALMTDLGAVYYERRRFELAKKYYEMAAEYGELYAILGLGYIWYYGRVGEPDYEKAYYYYNMAKEMGDPTGAYKVADMYKNGRFVQRDPARYEAIIEQMYPVVRGQRHPEAPVPEIFTRLAGIRAAHGRVQEALALYDEARAHLARRIRFRPFFGDLSIMKYLIMDTYRLRPFDPAHVGLYELYYLLQAPVRVRFSFEGTPHEAQSVKEEDGTLSIRWDEKWFRTVDDFFERALLDGELLTLRDQELFDFEVIA